MMNYRTLKKSIIEMNAGEKVYINSIGLSLNAINTLRTLICDGIITPDIEEVKKTYKDVENVMNGKVILPQMDYIRK